MPSKSYIDFLELLEDVDSLTDTHFHLSKGKVGRKKLGFLTRSAVVMLCAAWERYNENLLLESINIILNSNIQAKDLPITIKQNISEKVKLNKNNIYPIELADEGWRNLWLGFAINDTESLHTPNSDKLNLLFKRHLGILNYSTLWIGGSSVKIDNFIKVRGEIAHNGGKSKYVRISSLKKYIDLTTDNAIEIDFKISHLLKDQYNIPTWDENYHRTIEKYIRKK
ncbi:MAE_28990/MAE_18760 family HEPN-like nuclease [Pseudotamlana agarivorans]|uniref:MAE_28990/MAE_18760 family HEPN-like nuclease n=1 Tax=Pseudotamlana agarivorans TaxID=481183 RepID=UPI00082AD4C1|nr:MAE_28990/MAE_18760 family HEPN-like nuclease [Tamlana agarivorans]